MDGGRYDDFSAADITSVGDTALLPRRKPRSPRGPGRGPSPNAAAGVPEPAGIQAPRPFHYASARMMMLGQLADMLPSGRSLALSQDARRLPVIGVRLTSRSGRAVHAAPALTEDALFVDHRDLAALDAGALVPDLAALVERVR